MSTNDEQTTQAQRTSDPSTRNGGGPPDPVSNSQPDAEQSTIQCPECGRLVQNFPNHVNTEECQPVEEDSQQKEKRLTRRAIRRVLRERPYDCGTPELTKEIDQSATTIRKHCKEMDDVIHTRTIGGAYLWDLVDS